MNISFELYKVFYHAAKELNFSEAANKLYVSQSAVSQSIRALEEALNCRLFSRNKKQVKLTQEGEILFKHVEQAFNYLKTGERSIQEIHSLKQGEIRIGASDTICKYYLLPYFKQFNQLYPQIKISVTNRTSPSCIALLEKGLIDVGVINIPQQFNYKQLRVKKLKNIQDVFIAGKSLANLRNQELNLKDLQDYPLLSLEKNTSTREFFDALIKEHAVDLTPEIELGSVDLLIELAKIGLGVSFVVQEYITKELAENQIFILNIREKIPPRYLGIITNDNLPVPLAAQKFIDLLQ